MTAWVSENPFERAMDAARGLTESMKRVDIQSDPDDVGVPRLRRGVSAAAMFADRLAHKSFGFTRPHDLEQIDVDTLAFVLEAVHMAAIDQLEGCTPPIIDASYERMELLAHMADAAFLLASHASDVFRAGLPDEADSELPDGADS